MNSTNYYMDHKKQTKIGIYVALLIVGIAIFCAPIIYKVCQSPETHHVVKAIATSTKGISFDAILDYSQKILGPILSLVSIIQITKALKPDHTNTKGRKRLQG